MKLLHNLRLLSALLLLPYLGFSQEPPSGILHLANGYEENNLIKLQADELNSINAKFIVNDMKRYDNIVSCDFDLTNHKLWVKYKPSMSPNTILGICERRAVHVSYLDAAGNVVIHQKDTETYK